jgi:hypothetical protein
MQSTKHESVFAEYIAEEDIFAASFQGHRRRQSVSSAERSAVLQNTVNALQRLRIALVGHETEIRKIEELAEYIQRLQNVDPPTSPEEQFNQLYYMRKWLFWVPVSLLQQEASGPGPAFLTIAHYYSTALDLEPLFPDLGSSFCAALALPALESIFMSPAAQDMRSMLQYPQRCALNYRSRAMLGQSSIMSQMPVTTTISPDALSYTTIGSISPAFTASPLHTPTPQSTRSYSSLLEVPRAGSTPGFGYVTQDWGAAPSPGWPSASSGYETQEEHSYGGFHAGLVSPAPIWT